MNEKIRINGFDLHNLSRFDDINQTKIERGISSNTLEPFTDNKTKLYTSVIDNSYENSLFLSMLSNPFYGISVIKGIDQPKYLIHGIRFKHSIGLVNFIDFDTVRFNNYAIKIDSTIINKDNFKYIIYEDFSTDTSWGNNTNNPRRVESDGIDIQKQTISWFNRSSNVTSTDSDIGSPAFINGDQKLELEANEILTAINTRVYSHYEIDTYIYHTSSSGVGHIFLSYIGGYDAIDNFISVAIDFGNNKAYIHTHDASASNVYFSVPTGFTFTNNKYYRVRIIVEQNIIHLFVNNNYMGTKTIYNMFSGDFGFTTDTSTFYVDKFIVRRIPRKLTSLPHHSSTRESSFSKDVSTSQGTSEIIYDKDMVIYNNDISKDSVVELDFDKNHDTRLIDKTQNANHADIRSGRWVDGYLNDGLWLRDGDVIISDDPSYSDLSEFNLNLRFKVSDVDSFVSAQVNPIAQKDNEFGVYHYKKEKPEICRFLFENNLDDEEGQLIFNKYTGTESYGSDGIMENYFSFDGSTSYYLDDIHGMNPERGGFSMWLKPTSISGNNYVIRHYSGSGNRIYLRYVYGSGTMELWVGLTLALSFSWTSDLNEWHHFVFMWEDGVAKCYRDGIIHKTGTYTNLDEIGGDLYIGGNISAEFYTGGIDDFRVFRRTLDDNEVRQIYNSGSGSKQEVNVNRLAFEIKGDILVGDTIELDEWIEAWFMCDGLSSFIFRRDLKSQTIIPEARKYLGECLAYYPLSVYGSSVSDGSINGGTMEMSSGMNRVQSRMGYGIQLQEGQTYLEYFSIDESNGANRLAYDATFDISFNFWIKIENTGNYGTMFSKPWNGYGEYNYRLQVENTTYRRLKLMTAGNGTELSAISKDFVFDYDTWFMATLTINTLSKIMKFYINNRECFSIDISSITYVPVNPDANYPFCLGTLYSYGHTSTSTGREYHMLGGVYSDFRAFNRVLSYDDRVFLHAKQNYRERLMLNSAGWDSKINEEGLLLRYLFQNDPYDQTLAENDLVTTGVTYTDGKDGKCAVFNNAYGQLSSYVLNAVVGEDKKSTISFWLYLNSYVPDTSSGFIVSHAYAGNRYYIYTASNGKLYITIGDSTSSAVSDTLQLQTWYHITAIVTNNRSKLYIDGNLVSTSSANTYSATGWTSIIIGALNVVPDQYMDGHIYDFRVYNYPLMESEISKIYNSGSGTKKSLYKSLTIDKFILEDKFYFPTKYLNSNFQVRCWELSEDDISNPVMKSIILRGEYDEGYGLRSVLDNVHIEQPYINQITASALTSWGSSSFSPMRNSSLFLTNQYDWAFNYGFHNTLFNSDYNYEFTYSAWVKLVEPEQSIGRMYIWYNNSSTNPDSLIISINYSTFNNLLVTLGDGTSYQNNYGIACKFSPFSWHKVDIVYDNKAILIYIDGNPVSAEDYTYNYVKFESDQNLRHDGYDADYYIDHTTIYDRALTPEEIRKSYVTDPLFPYYNGKLIMSSREKLDDKSSLFIENGLFGIRLSKMSTMEANKSLGEVQLMVWDNGWKRSGKLAFKDQEGL